MKKNKGITMLALVITIVVLLIILGISVGQGSNVIKRSQLENLKTNMLLIEIKAKEKAENANFKLGTNPTEEEKKARLEEATKELIGEKITESNIFEGNINITKEKIDEDNSKNIYYYKISTQDLKNIGLPKVISDDKNGWYIIKYDIENTEIEIYNTKGFENEKNKYYSLTEIQELNI